MSFVSDA